MNVRLILTCAASLALAAGIASAQEVLTYSFPSTGTNWSTSTQVAQFDPTSLGTLTQVTLIFSGDVSQSGSATNGGPAGSTYDLSTTAILTLSNPSGTLFTISPVSVDESGIFGAPFSSVTFNKTTAVGPETSNPDLAAYIGSGSISFTATASANTVLQGSNNIFGSTTTKADSALVVEYTYTPIPEPATFSAVLGAAVFAAAALRRRPAL